MTTQTQPLPLVQNPPGAPARYGKKELIGDLPTWCPGCGDFSILSIYFKLMEKLQVPREKITSVAGIGCSSRFPYFVNAHGVHFVHGRGVVFASGVSLSRPDLHVFMFGGDGDAFSIGGNYLDHAARKNIKMTYVIMDNFVYGLTKKQTSPTSPLGFKSKTDPTGAIDQPINSMKKLVAAGASFIARTHSHLPNHVAEMMELAMAHEGFSVIECLSESSTTIPTVTGTPEHTPVPTLTPAGADIIGTHGTTTPVADSTGPVEESPLPTGEDQGETVAGALTQGTSAIVLLKNLSVVFVVVLVTLVFYMRWNKREQ